MLRKGLDVLLALVGAAAGGALGYVLFIWIYQQGLYAILLPGALLGLGSAALSRQVSWPRGILCAIGALVLELYTEWRFFPFAKDESLGYFLQHVFDKVPIKLVMIALGVLFACWWGKDALLHAWLPHKPARPQPAPPRDPA